MDVLKRRARRRDCEWENEGHCDPRLSPATKEKRPLGAQQLPRRLFRFQMGRSSEGSDMKIASGRRRPYRPRFFYENHPL